MSVNNRFIRKISVDDFQVEIDLATQVLRLAVPKEIGVREEEVRIASTLSGLGTEEFASASLLAFKAKQFDDGLYAAAELAAQNGAGDYPGKEFLLTQLAQELARLEQPGSIVEVLFAATQLGGLEVRLPEKLEAEVKTRLSRFLADDLVSKPIGFYTWTDSLRTIFQQDRMLQTEIEEKAGIEAVVRILHGNKQMRAAYNRYLGFISKLTNPLTKADLRNLIDGLDENRFDHSSNGLCFFPPSMAHETNLIKQLYGDRPIPDGFNLADEMIKRIRAGSIDLTPTDRSGWYDHQTWSLEPLVIPERMPEAARLRIDHTYRDHLVDMFKGIIALTRETHVKQLEIPMLGASMRRDEPVSIDIRPELTIEPLAAYYLRRALSYKFIRNVLVEMYGEEALEDMRRLTAVCSVGRNLNEELKEMEALFHGAYVIVNQQLGLPPDLSIKVGSDQGGELDAARFEDWARDLDSDEDMKQDPRMMVPVFYDIGRRKIKAWVFLGWATRPVEVSFQAEPKFRVQRIKDAGIGKRVRLNFATSRHQLIYPVSAEVYVEKILNREEFRRHCDKYKTRAAILENLISI